jgi:hypothetical protein
MEICPDYSAESFANAFLRFWARRGVTQVKVHLDNSTAFQAGAALLSEPFGALLRQGLDKFAQTHNVQFQFAPVKSPWTQGAVERLVGLTKASLRPALYKQKVTDDALHTLVCGIEAVQNTRPLCGLTDDPNDPRPLTPASLIAPASTLLPPSLPPDSAPGSRTATAERLRQAYVCREDIIEAWWQRWRRDYFTFLRTRMQQRSHSSLPQPSPKAGELYLLSDATPRGTWKLCRILRTRPGPDNIIRYVDVKTSTGYEVTRSVSHLIPVELEMETEREDSEDEQRTHPTPHPPATPHSLPDSQPRHPNTLPLGKTARELRAERRSLAREAIFDNP